MAGMHEGHRERLRTKLRKFGFECLEDHEKLEYLLFSFIPRRDTNPIAHELIATFGSFKKVLDADVGTLASVKGMTENAALFLHLLPEAFSSYLLSEKDKRLQSIDACAATIIARIGRKKKEAFLTIYLEESGKIIKMEESTISETKSVEINRDRLVATAVQCGAEVVVIGHNHPSGNLSPSEKDIESTNHLVQALGMVGIRLSDHLIVSDREYYSMSTHGDLVQPVDLKGSMSQFAQGLLRRENDVNRLRLVKR